GVIEKRFLATNTEAKLDQKGQIRVGDGIVNANECEAVITFGVDRMPLWEVDVESLWSFVVTLHDAVSTVDRIRFTADAAKLIRDVTWKQRGNALEIRVDCHLARFQGYRIHASDSVIQFAMIRPRTMKSGLRGKRIAVDPGHGGAADGAIGPRGTKEKDVVLKWAHVLERSLRSAGAEVVLTRNSDSAVSLHERIDIARNADCDLFLSLHANALPDGENPAERHGCGVYYYNSLSRSLAETVQAHVVESAHLNNDGVFDANLAVIRPTDFPAVLIESAYMMHPEEELMLQDDKFLDKLSRGVKMGLQEYFNNVSSR
ncbi:MAG: N-acetylmuramoyl-L-alanine amidase, partial [Calditrichaeota bacterium]|nr:N-acetylmuramoyl-L-alanine amidase [Calditrichota bacterium]